MPRGDFRWNEWNSGHATKHGCTIAEIELVVRRAGRGYPRKIGNDKRLVIGRGTGGRFVQVVFLLDEDKTTYVIHAMPT